MKLVVPLTIPITRRDGSPASDSRSGRMRGIAPGHRGLVEQVDPWPRQAARPAPPRGSAISSLLAVTTGLPAAQRRLHQAPGRVDATDQLDHHVHSRVADQSLGVAGEHAAGHTLPGAGRVATATPTSSRRTPERAAMASASERSMDTRAPPTFPQPSTATPTAAFPPSDRRGWIAEQSRSSPSAHATARRSGPRRARRRRGGSSVEPDQVVVGSRAARPAGRRRRRRTRRPGAAPCCSSRPSSSRRHR